MSEILDAIVIGAGISGLLAARDISLGGHNVLTLEKSRGLGGRMAVRRHGDETFDHGAQYFTVRDRAFQELVDGWIREGCVKSWFNGGSEEPHPRYCGVRGMTAVGKHLAGKLAVKRSVQVVSVAHRDNIWIVRAADGSTWKARTVLLSAPVPQSLALLEAGGVSLHADLAKILAAIRYDPCLALMVTLEEQASRVPSISWVRLETGVVEWLADNRIKGVSTSRRPALTLHGNPNFSREFYTADESEVTHRMLEAARPWIVGEVVGCQLHRWRYSRAAATCPDRIAVDPHKKLVFCGDGFGSPRVEGAALSGMAAAVAVHTMLGTA